MEKIRFGKTGLMVSKTAFGGIPIMRLEKPEASRVVRESLDMGINFIDTATGYTDSEEKIGDAIKGLRREDIVIASKSPASDKKVLLEHIDLSLKRLGVDYIDIYQIHNATASDRKEKVFIPGGSMEGLEEAIKAGKIRHAGFSAHSVPIAIELMKTGKFSVVQLPFNYIDDAAAAEAVPLAKELDIGFIAMKPMGGGLLYDAGLAFRYLMQFGNVVPDPGIEKVEEIREIIEIINKNEALCEEDRKEIEKQKLEFGPSWCHRCDYCSPCPQGIQISAVLCAQSAFKRMDPDRARSFVGPSMEKALGCTECWLCVSRCPYDLDIPALLKKQRLFWDEITA